MDAIINLQGIKVHVGFYRDARLWQPDPANCYVTNDAGDLVAQIDSIDALGAWVPGRSWLSLRDIAKDYADEHHEEWDRAQRQQAHADAIEARKVA